MSGTLFLFNVKKIFADLPVKACYLYGSYAEKKANEQSDYDLAIFVENKSIINLRDLLKKIITGFKYPEKLHLSLVDLNSSSPLYMYQIIKKGHLIYEKSLNERVNLESYIMRLYFDDQKRQEIYYQKLKESYAG